MIFFLSYHPSSVVPKVYSMPTLSGKPETELFVLRGRLVEGGGVQEQGLAGHGHQHCIQQVQYS